MLHHIDERIKVARNGLLEQLCPFGPSSGHQLAQGRKASHIDEERGHLVSRLIGETRPLKEHGRHEREQPGRCGPGQNRDVEVSRIHAPSRGSAACDTWAPGVLDMPSFTFGDLWEKLREDVTGSPFGMIKPKWVPFS